MMILFRNDDVRNTLDKSLVTLTEAFIDNEIPICHAVEPANVSMEVVNWLTEKKRRYPDLIEIIQHGYNHNLNVSYKARGKVRKGEFGGKRGFDDQLKEIIEGKEMMNTYFGDLWFEAFTFPFGGRNDAAYLALSEAGFKVVNSSFSSSAKHQLFYAIGKILRRRFLWGKPVSFNLMNIPGTNLFEIDMCYGFISSYINEQYDAILQTQEYLKQKYLAMANIEAIGILIHHRYHNSEEKIKLVLDHLHWLKNQPNVEFTTQEKIYMNSI